MKSDGPQLGKIIEGEAFRDAVHVAIAPVLAGEWLTPGQRVKLKDGVAYPATYGEHIGVVDPFLPHTGVEEGQRFYLFLLPGSVTGLRHVYSHPAFKAKVPGRA